MQLTPKQRKFISHYVEGNNGAVSARRAGYGKGAAVRACDLLKRPDIREEIEVRQMAMRLEAGLSKGNLIRATMKAHDQARTVNEKLKAINLMAKLAGFYPK